MQPDARNVNRGRRITKRRSIGNHSKLVKDRYRTTVDLFDNVFHTYGQLIDADARPFARAIDTLPSIRCRRCPGRAANHPA